MLLLLLFLLSLTSASTIWPDSWTASSAEFGVGPKTRRDKARTNAAQENCQQGRNLSFLFSSKEINNAKYNKFRIYQNDEVESISSCLRSVQVISIA